MWDLLTKHELWRRYRRRLLLGMLVSILVALRDAGQEMTGRDRTTAVRKRSKGMSTELQAGKRVLSARGITSQGMTTRVIIP